MESDEGRETHAQRDRMTAELLSELEQELRKTPVAEHVRRMLATLSTLAIQRLGKGEGGEELRDLGQAHLAIECFRVLSETLVAAGVDEHADTYKGMLAQMQLAFVAELGKPEKPESGAQEEG